MASPVNNLKDASDLAKDFFYATSSLLADYAKSLLNVVVKLGQIPFTLTNLFSTYNNLFKLLKKTI